MTSKAMHYDFKQKLNKIDSQKNRNLLVPEIDWKLNEAQKLYIKMIAQPMDGVSGFESSQRTIDDIRTVVTDQKPSETIIPTVYDETSYLVKLPDNYWFFNSADVIVTKGECKNKKMRKVVEVQHDDEHEVSPFNVSSFEWREVNISFISEGIRVYTDGTFVVNGVRLSYIRFPRIIHNAEDFEGGTYDTLEGQTLTGTQDCELPIGTHEEIVDLAVLITATDLGLADFQLKRYKLSLNNLK